MIGALGAVAVPRFAADAPKGGATVSGAAGAMAASGITATTNSVAIPATRPGVSPVRGTPLSRIASSRPSKSERRAIASAAVGTVAPTVRTMLKRCSA